MSRKIPIELYKISEDEALGFHVMKGDHVAFDNKQNKEAWAKFQKSPFQANGQSEIIKFGSGPKEVMVNIGSYAYSVEDQEGNGGATLTMGQIDVDG